MASVSKLKMDELNVLGQPLSIHGTNPITGFFRDGYCKPSPLDPAEHTLAGILTADFLEYSKSQGNDLVTPRPGFQGLEPGCKWCLCVTRWKEAMQASLTHPLGEKIVPGVNLQATSMTVLNSVTIEQLRRFEDKKG